MKSAEMPSASSFSTMSGSASDAFSAPEIICVTEAGTPAGAYITQERLRSKSTPCSL